MESAFGHMRMLRYVKPFYLNLMGFNAVNAEHDLIARVGHRGRKLSTLDISQLLQMHWRPRAMGAWYAIAAQDPSLSAAVHDSLETCLGHFTSPPLITATLVYPNAGTAGLLLDYIEVDQRSQWGAAGVAAAALARLEPKNEGLGLRGSLVTAEDIELVDKLLGVARALQS